MFINSLFFFVYFNINRWNNDDEDTDDRKIDLGNQSTINEENNRKRKSRWNGR
jgi:hypothetical protein